jgi:hypothetical protein
MLGDRAICCMVALLLTACSTGPRTLEDPVGTLRTTGISPRDQLDAMAQLDAQPEDKAYLEALHRTLWLPGYTVEVREAALQRLEKTDFDALQRTIRQQLPRLTAMLWLERLCEIVGKRGWVNQTPALVSSWARPMALEEEANRPEYKALAVMHGPDRVTDVVFETFMGAKKVSEQGLRTRCWDLMERLGQRDRLVALLTSAEVAEDDLFLRDLQRAAIELGMVPHNREEILWLRKLCEPEYADFWSAAMNAIGQVPASLRSSLEVRDLPVIVAAMQHEPEVLDLSREELYDSVQSALRGRRRHAHGSNVDGAGVSSRNTLMDWRGELTWGDLAAMRIALRAMEVPEVVAHLFDYAERDKADESTEYGGVIRLDEQGRFEVLEFPPRIREHDQKFIASQEMLDAAYTAQFHFHFHVQEYRNERYAGPGFGDANYATNLRANCLVFTFVSRERMNVDYYRHTMVQVDLGEIGRGE